MESIMPQPRPITYKSSMDFMNSIFDIELSKQEIYNQEIVRLVKKHLGQSSIRNKAGNELAEELILLASQPGIDEGQ